MAEAVALNGFLDLLRKSKLLTPAQCEVAVSKLNLDKCGSAREAAQMLVRNRVITPFQAERLLEGRYRGFLIDRYKVREILGVGGMGCLYIAEDTAKKEKIALKILDARHELDAGMLTRLKLEARAGMELNHPNIVKTFGMDSTGAVTFMVMELVRGVSLHELVSLHGALDVHMACSIARQAAVGLQCAHENGIIHRDVKPANFLVTNDGTTKVLDFGLALLTEDADDEFSLAMIFGHDCLGTPDFISPEQSLDSGDVDPRTDIYSLGATLYLSLTGKLPFPMQSTVAKLEAQRTLKPKPLRVHRPDLPEEVIAIVEKMMEKNREDRYGTAAEVASALAPFAKQRNLRFEFREIITLRAKQAQRKRANQPRRSRSSSSITGSSAIWGTTGSGIEAEIDTAVNKGDTPPFFELSETQQQTPAAPPVRVPSGTVDKPVKVPHGWHLYRSGQQRPMPMQIPRYVIGRNTGCDLQVTTKGVSGEHCELVWDGDHWVVRDLRSRNGTTVNGSQIQKYVLRSGDVVGVASEEFRLGHFSDVSKSTRPQSGTILAAIVALIIASLIALVVFF